MNRAISECLGSSLARSRAVSSRPLHFNGARQIRPRPQLSTFPVYNAQRRHAGTFTQKAKSLWYENPFTVSLAAGIICLGAGSLVYVNYFYQSYIIGAFAAYPEDVAKKLRRALYYTNTDFDPKSALKYYRQALLVAEEQGMDPMSDEIIGIKIKVAELMERINNVPKAIEVLKIVARDCVRWEREFGRLQHNKQKRTRVLAKTVAIHIKLGELYSSPFVWDLPEAEARLVWAVETILKEKQRRQQVAATEETDGPWISDDEFGASLEALAHNYEEKSNHRLAAPLFLQALTVKPVRDCHSVVLMNNLAASLAQQGRGTADARQWAQKALDVAAGIVPPERTEECDTGCAVAMYNLGDFAERAKDLVSAKRHYNESLALSKAVGFDEGVETSQAALRRLG